MKNIKVSRAVRSEAVTHAMADCARLPEVAKQFGVSQGELRRWVPDQILASAMDEVASAPGDAIATFDRANAGQGLS